MVIPMIGMARRLADVLKATKYAREKLICYKSYQILHQCDLTTK